MAYGLKSVYPLCQVFDLGAVVLTRLERKRMSRIRKGNIKGEDCIQGELFIKGICVIFR